MPRPFLKQHQDARRLARYVMRQPGEFIGGNVLAWSPDKVVRTMTGGANIDPPRYLHITISMPPGLRLEVEGWKKIFSIAFREIGLRVQELPHFIWRHADSECDHADAMITLRDFSGRDVHLSGCGAKCDRADLAISEHLELPRPHVPDYGRWPKPGLFHRRKRAAASAVLSRAFTIMNDCLRYQQPRNLDEFAEQLARRLPDFDIGKRQSKRERAELELRLPTGGMIGARAISKDLTPSALEARFQLFRQVAGLRAWFSDMLLLFGSSEIYDQWLKERKVVDVEEKDNTGGDFAWVPENRRLAPGPDHENRGRRRAPSGNASDARDGSRWESGLGRTHLPGDRGDQDAAARDDPKALRNSQPAAVHGEGPEPAGRTLGKLIGRAAAEARHTGEGWHPRIASSGQVGIAGPNGEWIAMEADTSKSEEYDESLGPSY